MTFLRNTLDKLHPLFAKGGKFEKLYPLYEAADTFLYTPGDVTRGSVHVRDALELKRVMITVVVALIPTVLMALYNTGLQANQAMQAMGLAGGDGWRHLVIGWLGVGYDPANVLANVVHGALYFLPVYIVTLVAGGTAEVIFSIVRGHEVNEGFLVTSLLFPLILPPTIPLWQVAVGILFGVVIGKEVFGGTGRNILNPALTARAFLYFAYPAEITGDTIWVAVDGFTAATPLGLGAAGGMEAVLSQYNLQQSFIGLMPGSMGETSALACLIGAFILIATGVGSWIIMVSCVVGTVGTVLLLNWAGSATNPMFAMPPLWHLVVGGYAFGVVYMATDPVSAAHTQTGKWFYGLLIGIMTALIRVVNPAFPEGIMLAILFGNVFAPLIDYFVVRANVKRRALRYV